MEMIKVSHIQSLLDEQKRGLYSHEVLQRLGDEKLQALRAGNHDEYQRAKSVYETACQENSQARTLILGIEAVLKLQIYDMEVT